MSEKREVISLETYHAALSAQERSDQLLSEAQQREATLRDERDAARKELVGYAAALKGAREYIEAQPCAWGADTCGQDGWYCDRCQALRMLADPSAFLTARDAERDKATRRKALGDAAGKLDSNAVALSVLLGKDCTSGIKIAAEELRNMAEREGRDG